MFPGVRRRILLDGEKLMFVQVQLVNGSQVPEHRHVHEQATYVIHGSLRFTIDGVESTVKIGDIVAMPSNVPHSVIALEDSLVIDVFSPPREDFRAAR